MLIQKRWNFGLGTIFSLIVVYFIYLYSKDKGWALLALASKWYLIIVVGLIALFLAIILLIMLFSLLMLLVALIRLKLFSKNYKMKKTNEYIDAEFKVKK